MAWWIRPLVRIIAALVLPLIVPAVITGILWALPGDPAEILCPPGICEGTETLRAKFNLDTGPHGFYFAWLSNAAQGDFGNSWRVASGLHVSELLWTSIPRTGWLVVLAMVPMLLGSFLTAINKMPKRLDTLWQGIGLVPAVIVALVFAAVMEIGFGATARFESFVEPLACLNGSMPGSLSWMCFEWPTDLVRLLLGALVLGIADGALAGAIVGTRSVYTEEIKQRYIQIAIMRGETVLSNATPNVLPALVGQMRSRVLHVLSGAVIVEVVMQIEGLGRLLWDGTLLQDFGVVLAASWGLSLLSGAMLLIQAMFEIGVTMYVRYSPKVPE